MAGGGFLQLGDIKGESRDADHKEWIDLLSFSNGISRAAVSGGNATVRNQGAAHLGDVVIVKHVDASTPKLAEAVCDGKVIPEVKIDMITSYGGGKRMPYLQYSLKNALVTSYDISGSCEEGQVPTESLSLNYEEIKWTYTKRDKDGSSKGKVEAGWKVEEGETA